MSPELFTLVQVIAALVGVLLFLMLYTLSIMMIIDTWKNRWIEDWWMYHAVGWVALVVTVATTILIGIAVYAQYIA